MLPPGAFTDPSVLEWELANVFGDGWICAGHVSAGRRAGLLRHPRDRAREHLRDRRRGRQAARLPQRLPPSRLAAPRGGGGSVRKRLRCPYHAWSYDLEGNLRAAPHMDEVEDFDPSCSACARCRARWSAAWSWSTSAARAGPAEGHLGELLPKLDHYSVGELRRGGLLTYEVRANWKGIAENYNECLHCPGVHPELNALSDYMSGESAYGAGAWCGGSMTLVDGRRDDGHRERARRPPAADREPRASPTCATSSTSRCSQRAGLAAPRLRDAAHALAARARSHRRRSASSSSSRRRSRRPTSTPPTRSGSGTRSTARTGTSANWAQKGVASRGYSARPLLGRGTDVHAFDSMVAARYTRRPARGGGRVNPSPRSSASSGCPEPLADLAARDWDVVVVGGGHNGLTAAAYLARAGAACSCSSAASGSAAPARWSGRSPTSAASSAPAPTSSACSTSW